MGLTRHPCITLASALGLLAICAMTLDASFPDPPNVPVALCPKVEYREVNKRGRIVRDTLTRIPEDCR